MAIQIADPTERIPQVVVFWNDGLGRVPMASSYVASLAYASSPFAAINNDADPELEVAVVGALFSPVTVVQLDRATRTFSPDATTLDVVNDISRGVFLNLTSGDFNGDGVDDLVLGEPEKSALLLGIEGH